MNGLFCEAWLKTGLPRKLLRLAQRLQVDSQLLTLLIKVAAFQSQNSRHVGHMKIVAPNFREHHFPFERFRALG